MGGILEDFKLGLDRCRGCCWFGSGGSDGTGRQWRSMAIIVLVVVGERSCWCRVHPPFLEGREQTGRIECLSVLAGTAPRMSWL